MIKHFEFGFMETSDDQKKKKNEFTSKLPANLIFADFRFYVLRVKF